MVQTATVENASEGLRFPGGRVVFSPPSADPSPLWALGVHGVPLPQYLRWADDVGLFVAMADQDVIDQAGLIARTPLNDAGLGAMLGVLCSLGIASRVGDGYRLGDVARDFLDRRKPFYIGPSLYGMLAAPLPPQLCKGQAIRHYSRFTGTVRDWIRYMRKPNQFGRRQQLAGQHRRNLPVNWIAARSRHFDGIRHIADIGGGSGAFAIPLAVEHRGLRVTLVDLPRALRNIAAFLEGHELIHRIELRGFNAHRTPWPLTGCDAILFGNVLHFCGDEECEGMLEESYRILPAEGRLFVHEMLWNERRDGPLHTALWNFWMATISAGRHRTTGEFGELLTRTGFALRACEPTTGGFTLIVATKV
jgi:SAM-dependent methyltransferase